MYIDMDALYACLTNNFLAGSHNLGWPWQFLKVEHCHLGENTALLFALVLLKPLVSFL